MHAHRCCGAHTLLLIVAASVLLVPSIHAHPSPHMLIGGAPFHAPSLEDANRLPRFSRGLPITAPTAALVRTGDGGDMEDVFANTMPEELPLAPGMPSLVGGKLSGPEASKQLPEDLPPQYLELSAQTPDEFAMKLKTRETGTAWTLRTGDWITLRHVKSASTFTLAASSDYDNGDEFTSVKNTPQKHPMTWYRAWRQRRWHDLRRKYHKPMAWRIMSTPNAAQTHPTLIQPIFIGAGNSTNTTAGHVRVKLRVARPVHNSIVALGRKFALPTELDESPDQEIALNATHAQGGTPSPSGAPRKRWEMGWIVVRGKDRALEAHVASHRGAESRAAEFLLMPPASSSHSTPAVDAEEDGEAQYNWDKSGSIASRPSEEWSAVRLVPVHRGTSTPRGAITRSTVKLNGIMHKHRTSHGFLIDTHAADPFGVGSALLIQRVRTHSTAGSAALLNRLGRLDHLLAIRFHTDRVSFLHPVTAPAVDSLAHIVPVSPQKSAASALSSSETTQFCLENRSQLNQIVTYQTQLDTTLRYEIAHRADFLFETRIGAAAKFTVATSGMLNNNYALLRQKRWQHSMEARRQRTVRGNVSIQPGMRVQASVHVEAITAEVPFTAWVGRSIINGVAPPDENARVGSHPKAIPRVGAVWRVDGVMRQESRSETRVDVGPSEPIPGWVNPKGGKDSVPGTGSQASSGSSSATGNATSSATGSTTGMRIGMGMPGDLNDGF